MHPTKLINGSDCKICQEDESIDCMKDDLDKKKINTEISADRFICSMSFNC